MLFLHPFYSIYFRSLFCHFPSIMAHFKLLSNNGMSQNLLQASVMILLLGMAEISNCQYWNGQPDNVVSVALVLFFILYILEYS